MVDPNIIELIQKNGELVRSIAQDLGAAVNYDEQGVKWLDGYIERIRTVSYPPEELYKLVNVLGSFLGECIRRNFGGQWASTEYGWGIQFNEKNVTFPFNKVRKQLENGSDAGDSIASYYSNIPALYAHILGKGNSE